MIWGSIGWLLPQLHSTHDCWLFQSSALKPLKSSVGLTVNDEANEPEPAATPAALDVCTALSPAALSTAWSGVPPHPEVSTATKASMAAIAGRLGRDCESGTGDPGSSCPGLDLKDKQCMRFENTEAECMNSEAF